MSRALPIDDRLASRRHFRLPTRDLIACGAWHTGTAAVAGLGVVALVAPWLIPMILTNPAGAVTELAFHAASIFVDSALFVRVDRR